MQSPLKVRFKGECWRSGCIAFSHRPPLLSADPPTVFAAELVAGMPHVVPTGNQVLRGIECRPNIRNLGLLSSSSALTLQESVHGKIRYDTRLRLKEGKERGEHASEGALLQCPSLSPWPLGSRRQVYMLYTHVPQLGNVWPERYSKRLPFP